ncbi:programmed cell death 1 ligand 2-like isoform X4 [Oncorhynchus nerka]|uniref:programmed cell death 1 ligand 2-like isoform X4 n=1 Tax=Oncorhynchus nerka TaxID=8023 RepID=UPI001130EC5D|nr:programmed cell death 1 ligand 2-like isoform X4 [Oncorhynchus nerka]
MKIRSNFMTNLCRNPVRMEQAFLLVLQVVLWPTLAALFTVEVDSPFHVAEFRGVVTMGCRFQPGGQGPDLSVIWHRIWPPPVVEVYRLENRQEDLTSQNPQYRGRVRLVTEEITNGWAKLELSMLRINDSGTYQCLVEMAGADYKQTTLTVKASYKTIVKSMKRRRGDEIELVCESEGYPLATMTWKDRSLGNIKSNDTTVRTPDQLFQVTSTITVKSSDKNNYTCALVEEGEVPKGPSASFDIPDEIDLPLAMHSKSKCDTLSIALGTSLTVAMVIAAAIFGYRRLGGRPGDPSTPSTNTLLAQQRWDLDPF